MRRSENKVDWVDTFPVGSKVVITHEPRTHGGVSFVLRFNGTLMAYCASAKQLSDKSFERGANEVKHDYDGKLSDGEP